MKPFACIVGIEEDFVDVGIEDFSDYRLVELLKVCLYLRMVLILIGHRGESLPWSGP